MNIVFAKDNVRVPMADGTIRRYAPGSHWPADDPYVVANPGQFSGDPRYHLAFSEPRPEYFGDAPVEEATANPGEKRNARRA